MRKLLLVLVFSFVFAEQFSGIIINEVNGQPMQNYTFAINGQNVVTDEKGSYQAEIIAALPNQYFLKFAGINDQLFVTNRNKLNLQLPIVKKEKPAVSELLIDLKINILENGKGIKTAEVNLYPVYGIGRTIPLQREVKDYEHSMAVFKYLQPTNVMYLTVSINNALYIQRLENIIPGKDEDMTIDLAAFTKMDSLYGVAYKNNENYLEILALPTANSYYIEDNVLPVTSRLLGDNQQFHLGKVSTFPESLDYYNLREFIFRKAGKYLTVYSDLKTDSIDVAQYGEYILVSAKGYHINDLDFSNFTPSILKDVEDICIIKEKVNENN